MPTLSQCQILKSVLDKKKAPPSPKKLRIAEKLKALDINDDEEDLFGLQELKSKLNEVKEENVPQPSNPLKITDQKPVNDSVIEPQIILPELPRPVRNNLYGLGFRKSEAIVKRKNPDVTNKEPSTNDIINRLFTSSPMPKKKKPPALKPRAVCFNYPGSVLTHLEVKHAIDELLEPFSEIKMRTIEFEPRYKLTRPDKMENTCRWVITLNSDWGVNRMTGMDFTIGDVNATLKRYDDVVNLEFKQYGRMTELMKMVKGKY